MYYLNSRYYDAKLHRFINADDISYLGANGDLQGFNLYAYCSNNPIMLFDPWGNSAVGFVQSAWWITQVDGPLPIIDALFWTIAGAMLITDIATYKVSRDIPKVKEKSEAIPKIKNDSEERIYYGADCYGGIFKFVTSAMTLSEACEWIEERAILGPYGKGAPWGIYTHEKDDAGKMAMLYSMGNLKLHDKEENTYPHYHVFGFDFFVVGRKYTHFHFWYGEIIK